LLVIEDAAQAHGATLVKSQKSKVEVKVRSLSDAAFSFTRKNLGALGMERVVTNDYELSRMIQSMRNYGSEIKYHNDYIGMNSRLDELQASF
jgi:dTDP-4-amino-4,6-dideoxygalactose transaminase